MLQILRNAWKIADLRKKLLYTLLIIVIFRVGSAIPVPFLDMTELGEFAKTLSGTHYGFTVIGRKVVILGSSFAGTAKAVEMFLSATEGKSADKTVYLTAEEGKREKEPEEPRTLRIMSFNVLCANTSGRTGPVCSTIAELSPDSFGVQEATKSWIDILKSKLGKEYACVGLGRDGGSSGEHSAVFYKKDKCFT